MTQISFPDLSNRTAEVEAARQGVDALDYDALPARHFNMIDATQGGVRIRISPETAGLRNEPTGMFVARSMMLTRKLPAAAPLMQDAPEGLVGTYASRSAAIAAAVALFAAVMEG